MTTKAPVTAIIPAYNAERFVSEALASVLGQSTPPAHVVVVDDGSTDGTAEVVRGFPGVTLIRQENAGIGAARNAGMAVAESEYMAFLDADDLWPLRSLQARLERADGTGADAVFGATVQFSEGSQDGAPELGFLAGAGLYRRSLCERVGSFKTDVRVGEFIDWWARAQELGARVETVPDVVLRRRIHSTNTGIVARDSRVDYTRVLRAALERRRGG